MGKGISLFIRISHIHLFFLAKLGLEIKTYLFRIDALRYMVKEGIYSQKEMDKMKEALTKVKYFNIIF